MSRTLYPPGVPLGDDAMTLRTHLACNRSTSDDEEIARNFLSARALASGDASLFHKVKRSFERFKAAAFHAGMRAIEGVPGVGGMLSVAATSLLYVLVKIAKGSLFYNTSDKQRRGGAILRPQDVRWTVRTIRSDAPGIDLANQPWHLDHVPGVVHVFSLVLAKQQLGGWLIGFYATEPMFTVQVLPRTRILSIRARRAAFLPWPRPRGFRAREPGGELSVTDSMVTRTGERPGSR